MRVFPKLFRILPNFHECFYNSKEIQRTCFLFLLENIVTRKRKTTFQLWSSNVNSLCSWLFLKRILYWFGIILELLSTCLVAEVCQASDFFFLMRKEPLSMTQELSKSMRWPNDHACFAMFDPLTHVLASLICFFLQFFLEKKFSIRHWLQYMLPMSFSSDVILVFMSVLNFQASKA